MGGIFEHAPLGAFGILIFCIISCYDTNRYLEKKCADDPGLDAHKTPVFWLSVVALSMLINYFFH